MELNFKEIEFQLDIFKTGKATSFQSSVAKFSHNSEMVKSSYMGTQFSKNRISKQKHDAK